MIKEDFEKYCTNISNIDKLKNSNILITGGTGFIGKWLTEMLIYLNENFNFNTTIYLLSRNIPKDSNYSGISYIHYIKSDIRNIKELPTVLNYIIHAAGTPDSK